MHMFTLLTGVEFGARMISIDGKQIKLQIWDTVSGIYHICIVKLLKDNQALCSKLLIQSIYL